MFYTLVLTFRNGTSAGFGPYSEYPVTELAVNADGSIQRFVWKKPDSAAGEIGPSLEYLDLSEVLIVAVKAELPPQAKKALRGK